MKSSGCVEFPTKAESHPLHNGEISKETTECHILRECTLEVIQQGKQDKERFEMQNELKTYMFDSGRWAEGIPWDRTNSIRTSCEKLQGGRVQPNPRILCSNQRCPATCRVVGREPSIID